MADDKVFSNGNINVWVVPRIAIDDLANIPADVVNNDGINISDAISWSDTTLPHATGSDDIDDRSIMDRGNATSRGANNYEASLTLFYPRDVHDPNSLYKKAWDLFSQTRHQYVLVVRTLQGVQHETSLPVFKLLRGDHRDGGTDLADVRRNTGRGDHYVAAIRFGIADGGGAVRSRVR